MTKQLGSPGEFMWTEHDTINNTPHLFNDKREAMRISRRYGVNSILKYRWSVE